MYRAKNGGPSLAPFSGGVLAVETSANAKLGRVSVTYVSQDSCPDDCPFLDAGCYGEHDLVGLLSRKLGRKKHQAESLARREADAIDGLTGDRPLRLHGVGDTATPTAVRILRAACERYISRGIREVWTYTHAWRRIPRKLWGLVSVLASCETADQARQAMAQGYAAALVVDHYQSDKLYIHEGLKLLPCPYQTRKIQCRDCRLCWDDARLREAGIVIAFAVHGSGKELARKALPVIALGD